MKKSNVRHLTSALAVTAFLISSPSFALGIGEMRLQSALNQNLQADISLILSEGEQSSDFQIGFAPNAKFDEAGIPWSVFLSKVKFKTVIENGKTVVKLSSKEVLKEPFLDFLLEIKSAKGTLYREFTVLVDPPDAYLSVKPPESTRKSADLSQRFVSAPTLFSSENEGTREESTKPKSVKKSLAPVAPIAKSPDEQSAVKASQEAVDAAQQKVIELEKQLSVMQKMIVEKDVQMALLKTPNGVEKLATEISPATLAMPTPVTSLPSTGEEVVAVLPPPALIVAPPIEEIPAATSTPVTSTSITAEPEDYFGILADWYYYLAAAGALLLATFGWFRLRARNKTQVVPEDISEVQENEADQTAKDEQKIVDTLENTIFDDEFDMNVADFENFLSSDLNLSNSNQNKQNLDAILYKADVYCSYGNHDLAEKLLQDEFINHPEAHDYALYLLKMYVDQDDKTKFKDFVFELVKLGKNNSEVEFWAQVSEIAESFYPEVLSLVPSLDVSDKSLNSVSFDEKFESDEAHTSINFDEVVDKKITFNKFILEFETPVEKVDEEVELDFSGFDMGDSFETEALAFELPIEKPAEVELDFSGFDMGDSLETEALAFELPVEKATEVELDFSGFDMGNSLETEALAFELPIEKPAEVELDFSGFDMGDSFETEALAFELPIEKPAEIELDFSDFDMGDSFEMPIEKAPNRK